MREYGYVLGLVELVLGSHLHGVVVDHALGADNAFGQPGGAAGVEYGRPIGFADIHAGRLGAARGCQLVEAQVSVGCYAAEGDLVLHAGAACVAAEDDIPPFRSIKQRSAPGAANVAGEFLAGHAVVQQHRDDARLLCGEPHHGKFVAVVADKAYPAAFAQTERYKRVCQPVRPVLELRVADSAGRVGKGRAVRVVPGRFSK